MKKQLFTFICEGETFQIEDVTTGPATAAANTELRVDQRPAGTWVETAPNEFTWTPMRG